MGTPRELCQGLQHTVFRESPLPREARLEVLTQVAGRADQTFDLSQ